MGADILATACPYCLLNFKDSVVTSDKADVLEIKDISEVVLATIGEEMIHRRDAKNAETYWI